MFESLVNQQIHPLHSPSPLAVNMGSAAGNNEKLHSTEEDEDEEDEEEETRGRNSVEESLLHAVEGITTKQH